MSQVTSSVIKMRIVSVHPSIILPSDNSRVKIVNDRIQCEIRCILLGGREGRREGRRKGRRDGRGGEWRDYAPVWRVLFDACEFDADQLGASHYDAMLVWRATVWRVFQFDAWQFGAFCQFTALFIFHVFLTSSNIRHCTKR